jgi:general secretion pathway protein D
MRYMTFSRAPYPRLLAGLLLGGLLATPALAQVQGQNAGGGRRTGGSGTSRQYPSNTQVGDALISVDTETRKIVVVTDEDTNFQIQEVIQSLDQPRPQVLIKVVFLEVTHNDGLDFGVEGGRSQKIGDVGTGKFANSFGQSGINGSASNSVLNSIGQNVTGFGSTPPGAGLYQLLGSDFEVTLRAIAQAGNAEILSRPSILARNNQPATISLGQQVPLVSNTRFDAVNGQINTVTYQNVGIILRVTPFISQDGMVEMIVSPETSQLADRTQWVPISRDALAPVINSRVADTVVVVPDGQTVIIGGLMQTQQTVTESKIPLLGDIPGLGNLFKRKQKQNNKTELMIFLTPHIVPAAGQLAALTAQERANATLKPRSISEEQLEKVLGGLPPKAPEDAGQPTPKRGKKKSKD